jgi:hypothetical protein
VNRSQSPSRAIQPCMSQFVPIQWQISRNVQLVLRRAARLRGSISRSKTPPGPSKGVGAFRRVMKPTPAYWVSSLVREEGRHALYEIIVSMSQ